MTSFLGNFTVRTLLGEIDQPKYVYQVMEKTLSNELTIHKLLVLSKSTSENKMFLEV